jgi:hypothetical protein
LREKRDSFDKDQSDCIPEGCATTLGTLASSAFQWWEAIPLSPRFQAQTAKAALSAQIVAFEGFHQRPFLPSFRSFMRK